MTSGRMGLDHKCLCGMFCSFQPGNRSHSNTAGFAEIRLLFMQERAGRVRNDSAAGTARAALGARDAPWEAAIRFRSVCPPPSLAPAELLCQTTN